mgnify:CR=1 FL=1
MLQSIPDMIKEIRSNQRCITAEQALVELANGEGVFMEAKPSAASTSIPRGILEMKMAAQFPNHETPVYVHCATGARATLAAEQLKRLGYTHVSVVTCSIDDICKIDKM